MNGAKILVYAEAVMPEGCRLRFRAESRHYYCERAGQAVPGSADEDPATVVQYAWRTTSPLVASTDGTLTIANTSVAIATVVGRLDTGSTEDDVSREFGVTSEEIELARNVTQLLRKASLEAPRVEQFEAPLAQAEKALARMRGWVAHLLSQGDALQKLYTLAGVPTEESLELCAEYIARRIGRLEQRLSRHAELTDLLDTCKATLAKIEQTVERYGA